MEQVKVSSKGQIAIPKAIRDALNLAAGTRLTLDVRGKDLVLSKEPVWRRLQGAGADRDLMNAFAGFKRQEREREDSRP
jgi:AbrB family looped-hinge helix DNA binding protein